METLLNELWKLLTIDRITVFGFSLIRIVTILLGTLIAVRLVHRFVRLLRSNIVQMMKRHRPGESAKQLEKRAATIGGIVRKTLAAVVWAVAVVMILREFNFDIAPILAGAGVIGLAVGFGAQNLVRDVISGLFMLIENQISVNDVAIINGTGGLVEEINLRTTVLRGFNGTVHSSQWRNHDPFQYDARVLLLRLRHRCGLQGRYRSRCCGAERHLGRDEAF